MQVFILPASPTNERVDKHSQHERYSTSDFDKYTKAFEENGARLDLQVRNQEAGFTPMLVLAPQSDSPGTIRSISSDKYSPIRSGFDTGEFSSPKVDPATLKLADSEATLPLGKLEWVE